MKNKLTVRGSEPKDILSSIPHWATMSEEKKRWLEAMYEKNGQVVSAEQLASVNHAIVLLEIDLGLDKKNLQPGEKVTVTGYINTTYGASNRAAWDRLKKMRKIYKRVGMGTIQRMAARGAQLLPGNAGIGLGEILSAVERIPAKRLPGPEEEDPKAIDAFISEEIPAALKANRRQRQQVAKVVLDDDAYTRIFFRGMDLTLRNAEEAEAITTPAQKRAMIKKGVSWLMKHHELGGSIQCQATEIPDGVVAQVGRPSNPVAEEA